MASWAFDFTSDWFQSSFTAQDLGAYMEISIRTRWDTPELMTLPSSLRGRLTVAALQRAFPGHYLTALFAPPITPDAAPFQLMRLSLSSCFPNLAFLRGGVGNTDSGSDYNFDDAVDLLESNSI